MSVHCDIWEPTDVWTGISDQARRKKLQNKLNQRAYRRRRKQNQEPGGDQSLTTPGTTSLVGGACDSNVVTDLLRGCDLIACPQRLSLARGRIREVYEGYSLRAPRPSTLHVLIRLRVLAALAQNASAMGVPIDGLCREDAVSIFNFNGPPRSNLVGRDRSTPPDLRPTPLQRTVLHHPWIDLFPFPAFRDNVLLGMDAAVVDDDELCADILEVKDEELGGRPSLIVWGQPWDQTAWEANEAFFRKWGFLTRGCPGLLLATNRWRAKRGERMIVYEA